MDFAMLEQPIKRIDCIDHQMVLTYCYRNKSTIKVLLSVNENILAN